MSVASGPEFLIDCEFCGAKERQSGEPINRDVMLLGQQTRNLTVCKKCAAQIDKLNKPARDEQERKDEEAAKAMQEKAKAEAEAAKPPDPTKDLVGAMSQMMAMMAQQQQQMMQQQSQVIELLAGKKPKKNAAKASD